ncbi:hypothetical protein KIPB_006682 [Kipferlia bialata]|uniref:Sodium/calcium exchanger membrane region domain-containing protein n=1 Tax=Kipferlia bialata TaxID=797122 RepID=A0A9K3CXC9_9EUKA|nr:hypothetical protein KIPB_006682 [Kipferlia bialata]|eukprot:g6682.t1
MSVQPMISHMHRPEFMVDTFPYGNTKAQRLPLIKHPMQRDSNSKRSAKAQIARPSYLLLGCGDSRLAQYILFPFGKYIERVPSNPVQLRMFKSSGMTDPRATNGFFRYVGGAMHYLTLPVFGLVNMSLVCAMWILTVTVPSSKLLWTVTSLMAKEPLSIVFSVSPAAEPIYFSSSPGSTSYFSYSVFGLNIILVNLLVFVFTALFLGYGLGEVFVEAHPVLVFVTCLIAVIPLAYYIGEAVSRISAKTNYAVGAVLNATFGSIIELILYWSAIKEGMNTVVRQAVTGSLLGTMLLMPGLAMTIGGIRHHNMRINAATATVSSMQLVVASVLLFVPTIFYSLYGHGSMACTQCGYMAGAGDTAGSLVCGGCYDNHTIGLHQDPVFTTMAKPLSYMSAIMLVVVYFVGLMFTFKTHSYLWKRKIRLPDEEKKSSIRRLTQKHSSSPLSRQQPKERGTLLISASEVIPTSDLEAVPGEERQPLASYQDKHDDDDDHGHEFVGEWTTARSITILALSTTAFALISETLIDSLGPAIASIGLSEEFVGT